LPASVCAPRVISASSCPYSSVMNACSFIVLSERLQRSPQDKQICEIYNDLHGRIRSISRGDE
jgi:hypothetical protein